MAVREIRTTLALDGEKQFKASMQDAAREMRVLGSEMRANTSAFGDNAGSMAALTSRGASLEHQTAQQREIVQSLSRAVEESAATYGEADRRTDGYRIQLNNATSSLNRMENELGNNNKALSDYSRASIQAAKDSDEMKKVQDKLKKAFDVVKIGVLAAMAGIAGFAKLALDSADELQKLSDTTGLSAERLQELKYAGANLGVELETITGAQAKLTKSMNAAKEGTGAQADAFKTLGISVVDSNGQLKDAKTVMGDAFTALNGVGNETERDALAMSIFGKSAMELNPMIKAGGDELNRLTGEARANGAVMSNEAVAGLDGFGDAMDNMKTAILGRFGEAFSELAPMLTELTEKIKNIDTKPLVDGLKWILDNGNTIAAVAVSIGAGMVTWSVASTVIAVVEAVKKWKIATEGMTIAQAALNLVQKASWIGIIISAVVALAAGLIYLWKTNDGFRAALVGAWETIKATVGAVGQWLTNFFMVDIPAAITTAITWVSQLPANIGAFFGQIPGIVANFLGAAIAAITQFGSNIITWVTTEIPLFVNSFMTFLGELPGKIGYALGFGLGTIIKFGIDAVNWVIAEVPKIISGIVNFFAELPGKIGALLTGVLTTITGWGNSAASWVVVKVPQIIGSIVSFFAQLPGKIANTLSGALTSLINWASNMIATVAARVPGIVSSIVSFFSGLPGKMLDVGGDIVRGIWDGINNLVGWLGGKVRDFAKGILKGMKDAIDGHSPSRLFRDEVGMSIGEGVAVGIDKSIGDVKAAMARMSRNLVAEAEISATTNMPTSRQSQSASKVAGGSANSGITQINNIYSPTPLTPSEIARQSRNAMRELALNF